MRVTDPNYIYNETKLISNVHNDCSRECFDIRTCNATWSLGGEPSSGHALPTAAVHIVRQIINEVIRSLKYL